MWMGEMWLDLDRSSKMCGGSRRGHGGVLGTAGCGLSPWVCNGLVGVVAKCERYFLISLTSCHVACWGPERANDAHAQDKGRGRDVIVVGMWVCGCVGVCVCVCVWV
jgi:hypothetical protein